MSSSKRLSGEVVTLEEVAEMVASDLPALTDADLAQIMCEVWHTGPNPIAAVIEPLVRTEMMRRRSYAPIGQPVTIDPM